MNAFLSLISCQLDIDKMYFDSNDPLISKYRYFIKNCEEVGIKHFKYSKAFMKYSNDMNDLYNSIDEHPRKKRKVLIVLDDMIAEMTSNKKNHAVFTAKGNIYLVFIMESYFQVPKYVRLNTAHCFIMNIPNKWKINKLQLIINLILTSEFKRPRRNFTSELCSLLAIDTILPSDDALRFLSIKSNDGHHW